MKILVITSLSMILINCGKKDYGPLDPVARSFGVGCVMGATSEQTCGKTPNGCFATITGSIGESSPASSIQFCARWCKDDCPSGTFCPNPDHAQLNSLFAGACFRTCTLDTDCALGTICDPSIGGGGCIPNCKTSFTTCDLSHRLICHENGHCL